jgi:hypothetical protein
VRQQKSSPARARIDRILRGAVNTRELLESAGGQTATRGRIIFVHGYCPQASPSISCGESPVRSSPDGRGFRLGMVLYSSFLTSTSKPSGIDGGFYSSDGLQIGQGMPEFIVMGLLVIFDGSVLC